MPNLSSTSSTPASVTSAVTRPGTVALLITYMSSLSLMSDSSAGAVPTCPWALRAGSAAHRTNARAKTLIFSIDTPRKVRIRQVEKGVLAMSEETVLARTESCTTRRMEQSEPVILTWSASGPDAHYVDHDEIRRRGKSFASLALKRTLVRPGAKACVAGDIRSYEACRVAAAAWRGCANEVRLESRAKYTGPAFGGVFFFGYGISLDGRPRFFRDDSP